MAVADYNGTRVYIDGTAIPNNMVRKGSYGFVREKRPVGSWVDANGIKHVKYYDIDKTTISFSIRERNLTEQNSLSSLLQKSGEVGVVYWNDQTMSYTSGSFEMKVGTIKHLDANANDIQYAETPITLTEL